MSLNGVGNQTKNSIPIQGTKIKQNMYRVSIDSALTRLEQFALGYGHKITTNYFNNESIKIQKTVRVSMDSMFTFDANC